MQRSKRKNTFMDMLMENRKYIGRSQTGIGLEDLYTTGDNRDQGQLMSHFSCRGLTITKLYNKRLSGLGGMFWGCGSRFDDGYRVCSVCCVSRSQGHYGNRWMNRHNIRSFAYNGTAEQDLD